MSTDSKVKELGTHEVEIKLHTEVKAILKVKVEGKE